jgi:hypothetical protein
MTFAGFAWYFTRLTTMPVEDFREPVAGTVFFALADYGLAAILLDVSGELYTKEWWSFSACALFLMTGATVKVVRRVWF